MQELDLSKQMSSIINDHIDDLSQLAEGNEIIAQTLLASLEMLVTWNVQATNDLSNGDIVFAFSFGLGLEMTTGRTNLALASFIRNINSKYELPIFAQWEIADALLDMGVEVDFRAIPRNTYLSTKGVRDQFCEELRRRGIPFGETNIVLISHPDHRFRCMQHIESCGLSTIIPNDDDFGLAAFWKQHGCDQYGYDSESAQNWTRSREAFVRYELPLRLSLIGAAASTGLIDE